VTRQFDVFKNGKDKSRFPFLLLVQHDLLSQLSVRVVVPLTPQRSFGAQPITRLNPVFEVDGAAQVMLTQMLGAVPTSSLGRKVANLGAKRAEIIGALDVLFAGV
jgi:toxin CcdB